MDEKHEFKKIISIGSGKEQPANTKPRNLIKSEQVISRDPVVIKTNEEEFNESGPSTIQPIIEDGVVIGIFFRCSCGRTEEIRFVYEN